jgi:hypothetical protein
MSTKQADYLSKKKLTSLTKYSSQNELELYNFLLFIQRFIINTVENVL